MQSVWRMLGQKKANFYLYYCSIVVGTVLEQFLMSIWLELEPEPKLWTK